MTLGASPLPDDLLGAQSILGPPKQTGDLAACTLRTQRLHQGLPSTVPEGHPLPQAARRGRPFVLRQGLRSALLPQEPPSGPRLSRVLAPLAALGAVAFSRGPVC